MRRHSLADAKGIPCGFSKLTTANETADAAEIVEIVEMHVAKVGHF